MSFILDALRKSEHERQRQTGPALVEAAVATPRPKSNTWATAAIALLLVNLVAIGVLLIWKSREEPAAAPAPAAANVAATPAAPSAAPTAQASVTQTLPQPARATASPRLRPVESPPPPVAGNPLERETTSYAPPMDYEAAAAAATPPPGPAAVTASRPGTVVYESLPGAGPAAAYAAAPPAGGRNLPTVDEIAAAGSLAEMRLELHVYSTKPQERFVFINGHRYREGDTTAEGAMVEEITQEGVVMSSGGNRFLLPRD